MQIAPHNRLLFLVPGPVKCSPPLFLSLQYSGFQQSADRCVICGHLIMDMVSDNCFRRKKSTALQKHHQKEDTWGRLVAAGALPSGSRVAGGTCTKPLVDFRGEAKLAACCVWCRDFACSQCRLKSRASSSPIPFWASLGSIFTTVPAQKCQGSAVLPCCGASAWLC